MSAPRHEVVDIEVRRAESVRLTYGDGEVVDLPVDELRAVCPCAACRGRRERGEPVWPLPGRADDHHRRRRARRRLGPLAALERRPRHRDLRLVRPARLVGRRPRRPARERWVREQRRRVSTSRASPLTSAAVTMPAPVVQRCYRHPDREAGRFCTRCGRPACSECLVQATVGSHCLDCAKAAKPDVKDRAKLWNARQPTLVTYVLIVLNLGRVRARHARRPEHDRLLQQRQRPAGQARAEQADPADGGVRLARR